MQTGHCWLQTAQQYTAFAEPDDDAGSRDDPGYVQWYLDHGKAYQQADPGRVSHASSMNSFPDMPALSRTYLAHHELASDFSIFLLTVIVIVIIVTCLSVASMQACLFLTAVKHVLLPLHEF